MKIRWIAFIALLLPGFSFGWQIEPVVTPTDKKLVRRLDVVNWITITFGSIADRVVGDPLHEAIILRAKGCDLDDPSACFEQRQTLTPGVEAMFAGVQWNDNPPFILDKSGFKYVTGKNAPARCLDDTIRLPRLPDCWVAAIRDAEMIAEHNPIGAIYPTLYRSHYGDLQFLHGMAYAGEPAQNTQQKMMVWAEFAYKVARGDILSTIALDKVPITGFPEMIGIRDRTVESLFTLGDPAFRGTPLINQFALGTLLHMIQDTFSAAHAERGEEGGLCDGSIDLRQPGLLKRFHSYDLQDANLHKTADTRKAFHNHDLKIGNNAIQVTRNLLDFYEKRTEWTDVQSYLSCVFRLEDGAELRTPDAGSGFAK